MKNNIDFVLGIVHINILLNVFFIIQYNFLLYAKNNTNEIQKWNKVQWEVLSLYISNNSVTF